MYKNFQISNYRCFRNFQINELGRINLITGRNNSGKSALLEALFIHAGAYNVDLTLRVNRFRGIETYKIDASSKTEFPWDTLFPDLDRNKEIKLSGSTTCGDHEVNIRTVTNPDELNEFGNIITENQEIFVQSTSHESLPILCLEYVKEENNEKTTKKYYLILGSNTKTYPPVPTRPPFPTFIFTSRGRVQPDQDAEKFSRIASQKQEGFVLSALQSIEPRLSELAVLISNGTAMLHGDVGLNHFLPLAIMGEGMNKIASYVLAIANTENGVVLLDEIENGFHYSVLPKLWEIVNNAAQNYNVQIFATTHSYECIKAASSFFGKQPDTNFKFFRLDNIDNSTFPVYYSNDELITAIDNEFEIR